MRRQSFHLHGQELDNTEFCRQNIYDERHNLPEAYPECNTIENIALAGQKRQAMDGQIHTY